MNREEESIRGGLLSNTKGKEIDNTILGVESLKPILKTYGSYYCAYQESGTPIVWNPSYIRIHQNWIKDVDAIKEIISTEMFKAPIDERKRVAKIIETRCEEVGLGYDDHDLSMASFHVDSEFISSGFSVGRDIPEIHQVFDSIIDSISDYVTLDIGDLID